MKTHLAMPNKEKQRRYRERKKINVEELAKLKIRQNAYSAKSRAKKTMMDNLLSTTEKKKRANEIREKSKKRVQKHRELKKAEKSLENVMLHSQVHKLTPKPPLEPIGYWSLLCQEHPNADMLYVETYMHVSMMKT